jgi:hypothetical protein
MWTDPGKIHECGNWDRGCATPRKGIHTWDFRCSVARRVRTLGYPRCFLHASVECKCCQVFSGLATFHLEVSPIPFHAVKKNINIKAQNTWIIQFMKYMYCSFTLHCGLYNRVYISHRIGTPKSTIHSK